MAKTSFQLIPEDLKFLYSKALQSSDRFTISRIRRKTLLISRKRIKGITEKSLLPSVSLLWAEQTNEVKDNWKLAGDECGLTGFKAFLKDKALRIKNEISGLATPSTIHQDLVGSINIESPATNVKIAQYHPLNYWVSRKVQGTRDQYSPILITEQFSIPLSISLSWKTNLISAGANPEAVFYCIVYSHYQGQVLENLVEIPLGLQDNWKRESAELSSVKGLARYYTAFLELTDVRGDLFFDNVEMAHSSQNWARDPYCKDVDQGFTKAFFQVPKHWVAESLPDGAWFGSIYPS